MKTKTVYVVQMQDEAGDWYDVGYSRDPALTKPLIDTWGKGAQIIKRTITEEVIE